MYSIANIKVTAKDKVKDKDGKQYKYVLYIYMFLALHHLNK